MKSLFKLVMLVLVAILIAVLVRSGPGHIILFIGAYRVDLSLTTFILIDLLLFFFLYYVIRIWINIQKLSDKINHK